MVEYFHALTRSIAHKYSIECGAIVKSLDTIIGLTHKEPLFHPWPRSFSYLTEYFIAPGHLNRLRAANQNFWPGEPREFVVHILDGEENWLHLLEKFSLMHAWTNEILVTEVETAADGFNGSVRLADSPADLEAAYHLESETSFSEASLHDTHLYDFIAEKNGQIVAKSQLVLLDPNIGYVADMFTAPAAREEGFGRALLAAMHEVARNNGRSEVILIPSRMTRESGFYSNVGYRHLCPLGVLIPG